MTNKEALTKSLRMWEFLRSHPEATKETAPWARLSYNGAGDGVRGGVGVKGGAAKIDYSVGLDALGDYPLDIFPPEGTTYIDANYTVECLTTTTQNHSFTSGWLVRSNRLLRGI